MLDEIKKHLSDLRTSSGQEANMQVCMMGPRAVGKTTVLTAVFSETKDKIAASRLFLTADDETYSTLQARKDLLMGMFERKEDFIDEPKGGIEATTAVQEYDFKFGIFGKDARINMTIKDFPGEFVRNNASDVKQFIRESSVIFIAIDTPFLMEDNGRLAIQKNAINEITEFFKESTEDLTSEKLVLFVPLKCEKYYYEQRISEVQEAVKNYYADLISYFSRQEKIVCAITPILTLGGVEFDKFVEAKSIGGTQGKDTTELVSKYKYTKSAEYDPMYCVQPIYYLLTFVVAQYKREKERKNILQRFIASIFEFFDNESEFVEETLKLNKYLNKSHDGYTILQGKELLKTNY